jgi:hypothetical protein
MMDEADLPDVLREALEMARVRQAGRAGAEADVQIVRRALATPVACPALLRKTDKKRQESLCGVAAVEVWHRPALLGRCASVRRT